MFSLSLAQIRQLKNVKILISALRSLKEDDARGEKNLVPL